MSRDIAIGILMLFIMLSLIVVFCALFIKIYVTKIKKYNKELFDKELEKQKSVNTAITETQDHTLNQVSQELHDDVGQQLTVINLQLEQIKLSDIHLAVQLEPISKNLRGLSSTIRELSHGLTTLSLDKVDLFSAFAKELKRCKRLGLSYTIEVEHKDRFIFPSEHKVIIYRIFQEILNNVLKHSYAKRLTISAEQPDKPVISFTDNGVGIANLEKALFSNGMRNMRSRARVIGYDVTVESSLAGTTIKLISDAV